MLDNEVEICDIRKRSAASAAIIREWFTEAVLEFCIEIPVHGARSGSTRFLQFPHTWVEQENDRNSPAATYFKPNRFKVSQQMS